MKTMKYRSIFATLTAVALSVFLFTSCEKESDDGIGTSNIGDRFEKYKRLQFSTGSATSSTNNGSGTFIGNGGSVSYVPPGGGAAQFAPSAGNDRGFTDITSTGTEFAVEKPFGFGGGSITIDGESESLAFAICAEFNFLEGQNADTSDRDVNIFVGIGGDFEPGDIGDNFTPDFTLFAYSYNGGSELGSFIDYSHVATDDEFEGSFLIFTMNGEDDNGDPKADIYFAVSGSVIFSGSEVFLNDVQLGALTQFNSSTGEYEGETVPLTGQMTCANYEDVGGE